MPQLHSECFMLESCVSPIKTLDSPNSLFNSHLWLLCDWQVGLSRSCFWQWLVADALKKKYNKWSSTLFPSNERFREFRIVQMEHVSDLMGGDRFFFFVLHVMVSATSFDNNLWYMICCIQMCTGIAILFRLLLEHLLCLAEITMLEYVYWYYMVSVCDRGF